MTTERETALAQLAERLHESAWDPTLGLISSDREEAAIELRRYAAALAREKAEPVAWLVADDGGSGEHRFRTIKQGMPEWTLDQNDALQFARRADAERFAEEDEDAWCILPLCRRILPAPRPTHAVTREDVELFLAAYHQAVWNAAENGDVAYDEAGEKQAEVFLAKFDTQPLPMDTAPREAHGKAATAHGRVE